MAKLLRLVVLSLLFAFSANAQDKKEVDLALALAIDISGSIDPDEAKLQRDGYVQAFRDPVIMKAILGGSHGRIAVAYYEWSDAWVQRLLIDWTLLEFGGGDHVLHHAARQRADLDRAAGPRSAAPSATPSRCSAAVPTRPSARCSISRATARTTTAGW